MKKLSTYGGGMFLFLLLNLLFAQNRNMLEISGLSRGEIQYSGFRIETAKPVIIKAVGAGADRMPRNLNNFQVDPSGMYVYAWIINAQSRQPVWNMTVQNTEKVSRSNYNRRFDGEVDLSAGQYEVYFTAQSPYNLHYEDGFFSLGRLLDKWLRGDRDPYDEDKSQWKLTIEGIDEISEKSIINKYHKKRKAQAVLSMTDVLDSDFLQQGFTLTEEGEFEVYAIGEAYRGNEFDYGWIARAENSKKVWEMLEEESEHAGGAIKNRVWRTTLRLEPGDYWVYYVTDDSHSPGHWNANPPFDPVFYGLTLTGIPGHYNPKSVKELIKLKVKPIIAIRKVGDNEYIEEAFEIDQEMKLRIYALGEGRNGEMFDYGWITDLKSGKKVWEMKYGDTRHGGGARKNRMVDAIITLPAGRYKVQYISDDSHSYAHFNSAKPYEPANWGIAIYPADAKYSEKHIRRLGEEAKSPYLITRIIRVGNDRHIRRPFSINRETKVRIYAIGEGSWDEMYDYGWIEDERDNSVVWEMSYEKTRWAGGAKKNRKVDTIITLAAGRYILHFLTDDSHSFNAFNADPPDDPVNYGISLYKVVDNLTGGKE